MATIIFYIFNGFGGGFLHASGGSTWKPENQKREFCDSET